MVDSSIPKEQSSMAEYKAPEPLKTREEVLEVLKNLPPYWKRLVKIPDEVSDNEKIWDLAFYEPALGDDGDQFRIYKRNNKEK